VGSFEQWSINTSEPRQCVMSLDVSAFSLCLLRLFLISKTKVHFMWHALPISQSRGGAISEVVEKVHF